MKARYTEQLKKHINKFQTAQGVRGRTGLRETITYVEKSRKDISKFDEYQRNKERFEKITSGILNLYGSISKLFDEATDYYLLYTIYWISMDPTLQVNKIHYKIAIVWNFISLVGTILITYSSMLSIQLNQGKYEASAIQGLGRLAFIYKIIFLSPIGPLIVIFVKILTILRNFFEVLSYIPWIGLLFKYPRNWFSKLILYQMGLTKDQEEGLKLQDKISQLFFESFPMFILQAFIVSGVL